MVYYTILIGVITEYNQCAYCAGHPAAYSEQCNDGDRATTAVENCQRREKNTQQYS